MIRTVTSVTIFNDSVGTRMSITYAEIDEESGAIIKDNVRIDKVVVKPADKSKCTQVFNLAQDFVDALEG